MRLPDIIVRHHGHGQLATGDLVEWRHGDTVIDLTGCKITSVSRDIRFGEVPIVKVEFMARLVEHDGTSARA